jgi:hypothetical protein
MGWIHRRHSICDPLGQVWEGRPLCRPFGTSRISLSNPNFLLKFWAMQFGIDLFSVFQYSITPTLHHSDSSCSSI